VRGCNLAHPVAPHHAAQEPRVHVTRATGRQGAFPAPGLRETRPFPDALADAFPRASTPLHSGGPLVWRVPPRGSGRTRGRGIAPNHPSFGARACCSACYTWRRNVVLPTRRPAGLGPFRRTRDRGTRFPSSARVKERTSRTMVVSLSAPRMRAVPTALPGARRRPGCIGRAPKVQAVRPPGAVRRLASRGIRRVPSRRLFRPPGGRRGGPRSTGRGSGCGPWAGRGILGRRGSGSGRRAGPVSGTIAATSNLARDLIAETSP
jgi:hypothetical protein